MLSRMLTVAAMILFLEQGLEGFCEISQVCFLRIFEIFFQTHDIMLAELFAIYHGLVMVNDLGYAELACYSDYLV